MKLLDLDPRWVSISRWDDANGTQHYYDNPPRVGGITFDCPVHTERCTCCHQRLQKSHRLAVWFTNPVDGQPPQFGIAHLWQRDGDSFETLTLSPSIDASQHVVDGVVCWHGSIKNGEIQ